MTTDSAAFVSWFRQAAPYINAFRNKTFVLAFGGEAVADPGFQHIIHDLALLDSLGIQLLITHGARPQIEAQLKQANVASHYEKGLRITDQTALACVKQASSTIRLEIEALLTMGVANSPMAGSRIRAVSGNFVLAQPMGVINGINHQHTGKVRRVDCEGISKQLQDGAIVLLSPIGYSPTGEIFNLSAENVAMSAAVALQADKLIYLLESPLLDPETNKIIHELSVEDASALLNHSGLSEISRAYLANAVHACKHGIRRVHFIERRENGALLKELFTRDGSGTLVTSDTYEGIRTAVIEDVAGILELISPLEQAGVLVKRSREQLEQEIDSFTVIERDGTIIACAALYIYAETSYAELACLAVHPDYQKQGKGHLLFNQVEKEALKAGMGQLFALTTQTSHWFQERGFNKIELDVLPLEKQVLYNYQRNSMAYIKKL